jgi:hypothetical protein
MKPSLKRLHAACLQAPTTLQVDESNGGLGTPTTLQVDESNGGLGTKKCTTHLKTGFAINCRRNRVAKNRRPTAMKRGMDG